MSIYRWMDQVDIYISYIYMNITTYIYIPYIYEYYSAIKKNEIMPFAATWMGLEIIISILSEARERQIM